MRTPRAEPRHALLLALLVVAAATAVLLATGGKGAGQAPPPPTSAAGWRGLVGSRPRVALGQRVIVVLKTPSLAQRVAAAGGIVDTTRRSAPGRTTSLARAEAARLAARAAGRRPCSPTSATRACSTGFSALVDPSAIPLIERDDDVAGVYPVRVAYPATISTRRALARRLRPAARAPAGDRHLGRRRTRRHDRAARHRRRRAPSRTSAAASQRGIDVVGGIAGRARGRRSPTTRRRSSATAPQMAGPARRRRRAVRARAASRPARSVLPIRVAGWQPDALGHWAIYARSDQIIAGLERAVDPNDDGDAHDAARVALVALAEPFAASPTGPRRARPPARSRSTRSSSRRPGTTARRGRATATSPARAARRRRSPSARSTRATQTDDARIVVRAGLATLLDGTAPLAGAVAAGARGSTSSVAVPRGTLGGTRAHGAAAHRLLHAHGRQHRRRARRARAGRRVAGARGRARRRGRRLRRAALRRRACRPAASASTSRSRFPSSSIPTARRARCAARASRAAQRVASSLGAAPTHAERGAGPGRELLVVGPRLRRPREARPRRAGRRARDLRSRRECGRLAALRHRQRLERRRRDRRGRGGAARAGAPVARRERARRPARRLGAAAAGRAGHGAGRGPRRRRRRGRRRGRGVAVDARARTLDRRGLARRRRRSRSRTSRRERCASTLGVRTQDEGAAAVDFSAHPIALTLARRDGACSCA